jgi:hypothetical protein
VNDEELTTQFYHYTFNHPMGDDSICHVNLSVSHSDHNTQILSGFIGISTGYESVPGTGNPVPRIEVVPNPSDISSNINLKHQNALK